MQEVRAACSVDTDCVGCSEMFCSKPQEEVVYYEAFPVKWDMVPIDFWEKGAPKGGLSWAKDHASYQINDKACGYRQTGTSAKYFCRDRTPKYGDGVGNLEVLWAYVWHSQGCLSVASGYAHATRNKPAWWDNGTSVPVEGSAGRVTGVTFNCCCGQTNFVLPYVSSWGDSG